ncbi:hypothetical protein Q8F92_24765, partial [Klebsiella pneumoniae]|nr:hypothetical protein [Klebsiella pneumoniae]
ISWSHYRVYDITTQIPVIYILESLGRKLARKIS